MPCTRIFYPRCQGGAGVLALLARAVGAEDIALSGYIPLSCRAAISECRGASNLQHAATGLTTERRRETRIVNKMAHRGRRQIVPVWLHVHSRFEASACGVGQIVARTNMVGRDLVSEVMRMGVTVIPTICAFFHLLSEPLVIDHVCVAGAPSEIENHDRQTRSNASGDKNIVRYLLQP